MEEAIGIEIPRLSDKEKSGLLGALARQALIDIGHSPDFHIYDLDREELVRKSHLTAGRYLLDLYDFYMSLDPLDRAVFVSEVLERGRHYRFWWLSYFEPGEFLPALRNVYSLASSNF